MFVGLDFDNTIADYDSLFTKVAMQSDLIEKGWNGSKKQLKEFILNKTNGEKSWMELQGKVYGEFMSEAEVMPGVINFLMHCKRWKVPVCIVSHKTEYGHFDSKKIPLRDEAKKWMKKKGLFNKNFMPINPRDIFFADTRKQKIKRIVESGCTHFVDDLIEVFQEPEFPNRIIKILFSSEENNFPNLSVYDNWAEIRYAILGKEDLGAIRFLVKALKGAFPDSIELLEGGDNSRVYDVSIKKSRFAMKMYPDELLDRRPRLETEFNTLNFLHKNLVTNIPKPEKKNNQLNIGLYSWVEGKKIKKITKKHLFHCINFVKKLKSLDVSEEGGFKLASEACLSGKELNKQIDSRLSKLLSVNENEDLKDFLTQNFSPLLNKVKAKYYKKWPVDSREIDLIQEKRILSPSDFGFHNALITDKDSLTFLDFDYFGWDDPVKLVSDFYWHPAMELSEAHRTYWLKGMEEIFLEQDKFFVKRLKAALPFYGLRWTLIILNEFLSHEIKTRKHVEVRGEDNFNEIKEAQLQKAAKLCFSLEKYTKENS